MVMLKVMCLGVKVTGMVVMVNLNGQLYEIWNHLRDRSPGHACGDCLDR